MVFKKISKWEKDILEYVNFDYNTFPPRIFFQNTVSGFKVLIFNWFYEEDAQRWN